MKLLVGNYSIVPFISEILHLRKTKKEKVKVEISAYFAIKGQNLSRPDVLFALIIHVIFCPMHIS